MVHKLIIIGGGEHSRVVAEAARSRPDLWQIEGFIGPDAESPIHRTLDVPHLGLDQDLIERAKKGCDFRVVLGVGAVGSSNSRRKLVELYREAALKWACVIHSSAWISPTASLGEGVVALARAVVNCGASLDKHCIVNSGAIIEHDVRLGPFVVVSPGAIIGGGVVVGEGCFIGLGANIRDHMKIGPGTTVGMGATVVKDLEAGQIVVGVPARAVKR